MKYVDLDESTSFLDHVYLGCTQRECEPNEIIIEQYSEMFESRISAGANEKLPGWENLTQKELRGPMTWKDMLKNALRDIAQHRFHTSSHVGSGTRSHDSPMDEIAANKASVRKTRISST